MRIIRISACMPAPMIPRQGLVSSNRTISQLPYKSMRTNLPSIWPILIPVVVILVFTEQSIIGANIPFKIWVIGAGGMNHDPLWHNGFTRLVTSIFS
jgi:hypothetical protein